MSAAFQWLFRLFLLFLSSLFCTQQASPALRRSLSSPFITQPRSAFPPNPPRVTVALSPGT